MGIKIELSANSREPLAPGEWSMELVKFEHGKSSVKETPFVQPVFKILDEDAVRIEVTEEGPVAGEDKFTGRLWGDKYWLSAAALFRLKQFAEDLGSELPGEGQEVEDEAEYAQLLTDALAGSTLSARTDLRSYEDKQGETKYVAEIVEIN